MGSSEGHEDANAIPAIVKCGQKERQDFQPYVNVKEGDVWIDDFPMMDQGRSHWCQIYTLARVMKYYGYDLDIQGVANLFGVNTNEAPSAVEMMKFLDALCAEAGLVRKVAIPKMEFSDRFFSDYNAIAQQLYKPSLYLPAIVKPGICQHQWKTTIDAEQLATQLNKDVWMAYLDECHPGRLDLFWDAIRMAIDQRFPLVWSVLLGFLPEERYDDGAAFHMRVILGYNAVTEEVLYSDSWGERHVIKRMSVDDAYMITIDLWRVAER